jgi:hypothetical protein
MHTKYGPQGFAAVSVSLDDPKDAQLMANVRKFLNSQKATFTNLVLDEKPEVWQTRLKFDGPPCVFVFNRDGKWTKFDPFFDYADVEKKVVEYLRQKAP